MFIKTIYKFLGIKLKIILQHTRLLDMVYPFGYYSFDSLFIYPEYWLMPILWFGSGKH